MNLDERKSIREKFAPAESVDETAERIAEWSRYFFSERHVKSDVPVFHKQIYKDLASDWKYLVITAPSEFSKTTICTLIYPLYRTVYYNEPYIVISSRVDDTAMEMLDEIKFELRYNDLFREVYGALLPLPEDKVKTRHKKKDSAHVIELENGTVIRSIPWRGNVRGRKRKGYRITLFIGDDPEEADDIDSPEILKKNIRWLDRSAVPRTDKDFGKIRIVGTRIGDDCTVDKLLNRKRWQKKIYRALVDDPDKPAKESVLPILQRKSIWENRWTTKWLLNERQEFINEGREDDWLWERQNEPPKYRQKDLSGYLIYDGQMERRNDQNILHVDGYLDPIPVYTYCAIDPAFSEAKSADPRAIVSFAFGYLPVKMGQKVCVWILDYDYNWMDPDEIFQRALDKHREFYYSEVCIETTGPQKIYEYMAEKQAAGDAFLIQHPITIRPIDSHGRRSKEDRIYERFKTMVRLGQLFVKNDMAEIRNELDRFMRPDNGLHILDALEMGLRYAIPCVEDISSPTIRNKHSRRLELEEEEIDNNWLVIY